MMSLADTVPEAASATTDGPLVRVRNLHTSFRTSRGLVRAVRDVSFEIAPGEVVGLVGESGSGKTVTALSMLRMLPSSAEVTGSVTVAGKDILGLSSKALREVRGNDISMIFQDPMTSLDPVYTVEAQMLGVQRAHRSISRASARARAGELLRRVGIADVSARLRQYPHQMSGGMRQRVLIAMALLNEPKLLIADEPTTALDVTIQAQIIRLLGEINAETGMSIIFVTHDLGVVAGLCDRVVVMYGGRLVETGTAEALHDRAAHPYTRGLWGAAIRPDADRALPLVTIEGSPPDPSALPPGCPFEPRCTISSARCASELPALTSRGAGHSAACFNSADGGA